MNEAKLSREKKSNRKKHISEVMFLSGAKRMFIRVYNNLNENKLNYIKIKSRG